MRIILLSVLCLCATAMARAEDVTLPTPVTEATVFLRGATLVRAGRVDLPAGTHRLLVPVLPGTSEVPKLALSGAVLGPVAQLDGARVDPTPFLSARQRAARDALTEADEALARTEDARLTAAATHEAAEARLAFLRSVSGGALTGLDAASVVATGRAIAEEIAESQTASSAARAALRRAVETREEATRVALQARRDFEATGAPEGPMSLLAVSVTSQGGPATLRLVDFVLSAGWAPRYDIDLTGTVVTLNRGLTLYQNSGLPFEDLRLRLSTADPLAAVAPADVWPNEALLGTKALPAPTRQRMSLESAEGAVAADMGFAPAAPLTATAQLDGPVVTYDYPAMVTLASGGAPVLLALDQVTLDARVFNRAAPRHGDTAYLMAAVTNTTGEPLLPGPADITRDGTRIGRWSLPPVPAGDTAELPFGPQVHLPVAFIRLENATGDRGLFATSGTRRQDLLLRLRNLSDSPEVVETRFALPYSESEDLEVTLRPRPAPDLTDVGHRRGVSDWIVTLAPGATEEIRIEVELTWPEDETLIWEP
ncbi:DUF4139 domain-containing protein [Jannaschia sp. M317]|uniref:DUF4139 domain-containing protein n=1 Tax=Jannaschia sp. M317 TaxID=2867011 RepID=UPI0021A8B542|nr:DUF4139 domain-containing protein [Jannaschia sp. M317]UWQ18090.1 DUF4139 domain-containing protein [Jannaschia sp. M317]